MSEDEGDFFEYNIHETPIENISDEFRNKVLRCKHSLYIATVLSVDPYSKEAQRDELTQKYLHMISLLYDILRTVKDKYSNSSESNDDEIDVSGFPEETRECILELIDWYSNFLEKNRNGIDQVSYMEYIDNSFHIFPYVQNDEFEEIINDT
jgi:hypothetical protein